MPSTIGDDPRISSSAVRDESPCGGEASARAVSACAAPGSPCACAALELRSSSHDEIAIQPPNAISATLDNTETACPNRVATAAPAIQTISPITSVETTCPVPARNAAPAVSRRDQPRCRAIRAIGTQWSGTSVCSTPTAATAATSSTSGATIIA
jgi:hypothetical protein